jgi:hypothetical protein
MAYRYNARGTLTVRKEHVDKVCSILDSNKIRYKRRANIIKIEHDERALIPSTKRADDAFEELAPYVDEPQAIQIWSELMGEGEIGFVDGKVRKDEIQNVWSTEGEIPTPDYLVDELKRRGFSARIAKIRGSRKSGRRTRVFEIEPGSGGPGCRITIKKRFWDSYDLLSVPQVFEALCEKYHLSPIELREKLHSAKFGIEVRNPALGGASSDMLYENLLDIVEERCEGIRTNLG